jgi:hypothetical protein
VYTGKKANQTEGTFMKHIIKLTSEERKDLTVISNKQRVNAQDKLRAKVFLLTDAGKDGSAKTDEDISKKTGITVRTIERLRAYACEVGPIEALKRRPTTRVFTRKLDGRGEAQLIVLAKGTPPEGRSRWTMQLLADQMVVLGIVDSLDDSTVCRTLKKTNLSLI